MTRRTSRPRMVATTLALALAVASCGGSGDDRTEPSDGPSVAASTTWVGAIAALAGASYIHVVAPGGITHPPDYDPSPTDLTAVGDAEYVLLAGSEGFADRLTEAAGDGAEVVEIRLENTVGTIESEVMRLAELFGTTEAAEENLADVLPRLSELGQEVAAAVPDPAPVVVSQISVSHWADWAGITVAGTYDPDPIAAASLTELEALQPTLVLEDAHRTGGQPLAESGTTVVGLVNFPGDNLDLVPVFEQNRDALVEALG